MKFCEKMDERYTKNLSKVKINKVSIATKHNNRGLLKSMRSQLTRLQIIVSFNFYTNHIIFIILNFKFLFYKMCGACGMWIVIMQGWIGFVRLPQGVSIAFYLLIKNMTQKLKDGDMPRGKNGLVFVFSLFLSNSSRDFVATSPYFLLCGCY